MPIPDRSKLRRKYLQRKTQSGVFVLAGTAALIFVAYWSVRFILRAVLLLTVTRGEHGVATLLVAWFMSKLARKLYKQVKTVAREATAIPHVPAVNPAIMPSEEVLVRMADVPDKTNAMLLRPTSAISNTPAEELLRSSRQ